MLGNCTYLENVGRLTEKHPAGRNLLVKYPHRVRERDILFNNIL